MNYEEVHFGSKKKSLRDSPANPLSLFTVCRDCRSDNFPRDKFCKHCGGDLETDFSKLTRCEYCGALNELNRSDCLWCGKGLTNKPFREAAPMASSTSKTVGTATHATTTTHGASEVVTASPKIQSAVKPGPHIPAGNRFAAHEQIISKIARQSAYDCARWIRNFKVWNPVNNGYSGEYCVEIIVFTYGIDLNTEPYTWSKIIRFASFGMDNIPEKSTGTFLKALKPFLDVYFPEEVEKAFCDVSPLIKRTTSVTYSELDEGWDFDAMDSMKCIHVSMCYKNPPAPKLKSW